MDQLIQTLIIGLANGLIFALVALGYTLVYGIIELINFAHGDVFMLGSMLAFGRSLLGQAPWYATFPGLSIFVTVLGLNFLGDGLREALDPRLRMAERGA
jgi:branched-chain amino acid transport system permease protein